MALVEVGRWESEFDNWTLTPIKNLFLYEIHIGICYTRPP